MIRKILLTCGIVSSAWYVITDVLGTLRYPGYRYTEQQFSELTAAGSPVRSLMIALNEFPYNLLVAAFARGVWTSADSKRAARITGAMLVGYVLTGMLTGVIFPMNTRESLAAGEGGLRNAMHPPGTIVMSLFIVLAMAFGSKLLGRRFRYYTYATIVMLVVFGVLASLQVDRMVENEPTPWMGIEERINIYATMLWVAVLAMGLLRAQEAR
jgi:amino acid transporter